MRLGDPSRRGQGEREQEFRTQPVARVFAHLLAIGFAAISLYLELDKRQDRRGGKRKPVPDAREEIAAQLLKTLTSR